MFIRSIKPMIILVAMVALISGLLRPEALAQMADNALYILALLCGLGVLWLTLATHYLLAAVVVWGALVFNMPRAGMDYQVVILALLILLGAWMTRYASKLVGPLVVIVGLVMILPRDVVQDAHVEMNALVGALIALLLTPIIDILTTRRKRASPQPPKQPPIKTTHP